MDSKKLAKVLGKDEHAFEVVKNSFDTLVLAVPVSADADVSCLNPALVLEAGSEKFKETYHINNIEPGNDNSFIILAEAVVKKGPASKSISRVYPCDIYGIVLSDKKKIEFYGVFPEDNAHKKIIKDLAKAVVEVLNK